MDQLYLNKSKIKKKKNMEGVRVQLGGSHLGSVM